MQGPTDALRSSVVDMLQELRHEDDDVAELRLEAVLADIGGALEEDLLTGWEASLSESAARELLAAVEAWASVVSSAVGWIYAPTSAVPRQIAGFAKAVAKRLRTLCGLLLRPLSAAASRLGATSFGLELGFPWGPSVVLTWS